MFYFRLGTKSLPLLEAGPQKTVFFSASLIRKMVSVETQEKLFKKGKIYKQPKKLRKKHTMILKQGCGTGSSPRIHIGSGSDLYNSA